MKQWISFFLILLLAGLLGCGCVSDDDFKRQNLRLNNLRQEVYDLKQQSKLRDMELERRLQQARQSVPGMRLELDRMRSELQRLINTVEISERRGTLPEGETLTLKEHLNFIKARLDRLEATLKLPPLSLPAHGEAETVAAPAEGGTEPTIVVKPGEAARPEAKPDEAEYEVAEALYKQQVYKAAVAKFKDFIKQFPRSRFAPSAQFYVGECQYEQKNFEEAILEYQKVIKRYPKSAKVSNALLKQAFSFLKIGDKTSAKLLLQKVVRDHPKSYSARVAKKKLRRLR